MVVSSKYITSIPHSNKYLSDYAIGESVFLTINGVDTEFIVINQGKPSNSALYDDSCQNTWLMMKDLYAGMPWNSSLDNAYGNSSVHAYLNGDFLSLFDAKAQSLMQLVKLPYVNGNGVEGAIATGNNGLATKVFLPSGYEIGWTQSNQKNLPIDGACTSYFNGFSHFDTRRTAYLDGIAKSWWLRTPDRKSKFNVHMVPTESDESVVLKATNNSSSTLSVADRQTNDEKNVVDIDSLLTNSSEENLIIYWKLKNTNNLYDFRTILLAEENRTNVMELTFDELCQLKDHIQIIFNAIENPTGEDVETYDELIETLGVLPNACCEICGQTGTHTTDCSRNILNYATSAQLAPGGTLSGTHTLDSTIELLDQITIANSTTLTITGKGTIINQTHIKHSTTTGQNMFENHGNLVIRGNSATERIIIDQNQIGSYTALWNLGTLTLEHVTIKNCASAKTISPQGAAISSTSNSSSIIMNDVIFENIYGHKGGALYIAPDSDISLNFTNITFKNCTNNGTNYTEDAGAGIYLGGTTKITAEFNNCLFENCSNLNGSAIYLNNSNINTFVTINNTVFNNCTSSGGGGAVGVTSAMTETARLSLSKCTFNRCVANSGSALNLSGSGKGTIIIDKCIFENNNCPTGEGGTVRTNGTGRWKMYIRDSVFRYNYSNFSGGAIYWNAAGDGASLYIEDSQFLNNSTSTSGRSNRGGALFLEGTNITIIGTAGVPSNELLTGSIPNEGLIGTLIKGNISNTGGGMSFKTVESATITGGINISLGTNIIITENTASYGGGVAFIITKNSTDTNALFKMIIDGSSVDYNNATIDGGGIYIDMNDDITTEIGLYILTGSVSYNKATNGNGGALNVNKGNVTIGEMNCSSSHSHPELLYNESLYGGGLYVNQGFITLYCGTIINNSSYQESAGDNVYIVDGSLNYNGGQIGLDANSGIVIVGGEIIDNRPEYSNNLGQNYLCSLSYGIRPVVILLSTALFDPTTNKLI